MASDVAEAEATSNTEAKTTTSTAAAPAAAAQVAPATPAVTPEAKVEGKAPAKEAAPVDVVFKDQEGKPLEGSIFSSFAAMAKESGWTQEVAEQHLAKMSAALSESQVAMEAQWDAALKADKEIGGSKLAENLGAARTAIEKVAGADYLKWLEKSKLAKNPETVKAWLAVSKAISPDKFTAGVPVTGRPGDISNPNDTSGAAFAKFYPATEPTNR
jgi:hypothetical protein